MVGELLQVGHWHCLLPLVTPPGCDASSLEVAVIIETRSPGPEPVRQQLRISSSPSKSLESGPESLGVLPIKNLIYATTRSQSHAVQRLDPSNPTTKMAAPTDQRIAVPIDDPNADTEWSVTPGTT
jgi:hypothetical protein